MDKNIWQLTSDELEEEYKSLANLIKELENISSDDDWKIYYKIIKKKTQFNTIKKALDTYSKKSATVIESENKRYDLTRIWDNKLPILGFIGQNPAEANQYKDDKTITILSKLAKKLGQGGLIICNRSPYISTDSSNKKIVDYFDDEENKKYIKNMVDNCSKIVYMWGEKGGLEDEFLKKLISEPYCLGKNKKGTPKHTRGFSITKFDSFIKFRD